MSDGAEIVPGSRVRLHLRIALEDGTVAISTFGETPLEFRLGDQTLQPGLELAIYGLKAGDTQTLDLLPEQAYGNRDPALVQYLPRTDFDAGFEPEVGQVVAFALPSGDETPGLVLAVEEGRVEVDFNHPLAGHEITFSVEVLGVEPPGSED